MIKLMFIIILLFISSLTIAVTEADMEKIDGLFITFCEALETKNIGKILRVFRPESTLIVCYNHKGVIADGIVQIRNVFDWQYLNFCYLVFIKESFYLVLKEISADCIYTIWEANYEELDLEEAEDEVISCGKCFGSILYGRHKNKWYIVHMQLNFILKD